MVDDEASVLRAMVRALERWGYIVAAVTLGADAMALVSDDPKRFYAAIVDLNLPDMRGQDLVHWLRVQRPDLKIVVASGGEAPAMEGVKVLRKPFLLEDLKEALAP